MNRITPAGGGSTDDQVPTSLRLWLPGITTVRRSSVYAVHPVSSRAGRCGEFFPALPDLGRRLSDHVLQRAPDADAAHYPIKGGRPLQADIHLQSVQHFILVIHVSQRRAARLLACRVSETVFDSLEYVRAKARNLWQPGVSS